MEMWKRIFLTWPFPIPTTIFVNDNSIDLSLAMQVAEYFGLTKDEAAKISADICETVKKTGSGLQRAMG